LSRVFVETKRVLCCKYIGIFRQRHLIYLANHFAELYKIVRVADRSWPIWWFIEKCVRKWLGVVWLETLLLFSFSIKLIRNAISQAIKIW